ncbi:hypothetical protein [Clostridium sp. UBA4548]|uniref:hypothetical protein n=1 Tax=Clostridium sp. UBA4548 TaxID=1946361 RepID=UPI0025B98020|nr:hypothetical protein [Clostridium sp. UBA4548]
MEGFTLDNIIMVLVALGLLILVIKFIKGVIRTVISLILILTLGVSGYNIFIAKKPVSYEIQRYKTDFAYVKEMKNLTTEASKAIDEIKENKNVNENVNKLMDLREKANGINHSEEASFIHKKYMNGFDAVITGVKGYEVAKGAEAQVAKLEELSKEINISFMDVIFPEK